MSTPVLSAAALNQIYKQAQALTLAAPALAPTPASMSAPVARASIGFDSAEDILRYKEQYEAAQKADRATRKKGALQRPPADPVIFDVLVSNELNRKLKKNFGIAFISISFTFTVISYAIIVMAAVYNWNLPSAALTALVIQAPLQMIGILYIMAKNLFPTVGIEVKQDTSA
jgi:hypothetical protein